VSDISHRFGLVAGVLLVAFNTLVSRIVANRKVPRCLPRRVDILVALKVLIGMIYIAGTVAMLVYSHRDGKEWVLLSAGVATAVGYTLNISTTHAHAY
jgi:uncharacterized membrane protein